MVIKYTEGAWVAHLIDGTTRTFSNDGASTIAELAEIIEIEDNYIPVNHPAYVRYNKFTG